MLLRLIFIFTFISNFGFCQDNDSLKIWIDDSDNLIGDSLNLEDLNAFGFTYDTNAFQMNDYKFYSIKLKYEEKEQWFSAYEYLKDTIVRERFDTLDHLQFRFRQFKDSNFHRKSSMCFSLKDQHITQHCCNCRETKWTNENLIPIKVLSWKDGIRIRGNFQFILCGYSRIGTEYHYHQRAKLSYPVYDDGKPILVSKVFNLKVSDSLILEVKKGRLSYLLKSEQIQLEYVTEKLKTKKRKEHVKYPQFAKYLNAYSKQEMERIQKETIDDQLFETRRLIEVYKVILDKLRARISNSDYFYQLEKRAKEARSNPEFMWTPLSILSED